MTEDIKKFLEAASSNYELQSKLVQINDDFFQAIINAANEHGINVTKKDLGILMKADANKDGIVSDDELAAVAGGAYTLESKYGKNTASDCACGFSGMGLSDDIQNDCICSFGGAGTFTEKGRQLVAEGKIYYRGLESAPVPMWCFAIGTGIQNNTNN